MFYMIGLRPLPVNERSLPARTSRLVRFKDEPVATLICGERDIHRLSPWDLLAVAPYTMLAAFLTTFAFFARDSALQCASTMLVVVHVCSTLSVLSLRSIWSM